MMFPTKLAALSALLAVANALTINSPASLIECEPTSLVFSGGTEPYYLAILPGGEVSATALESLDTATSSPVTWTVNLASGTNVTIRITDSTGTQAYSSAVVIQAGSSSSCLTSSSSGSSTAAASGTSSGSSASTTGSSASSGTASTGSTSATGSSTASSSTSSSSSSSAALTTREMTGGLAAVFGFVATAFGMLA